MVYAKNAQDLRNHKITVRLNQNDYEQVRDVAKTQHLSMAELFRLLLSDELDNQKVINMSESDRAELINTITKFWDLANKLLPNLRNVGNNINQIAHKYNSDSMSLDDELNQITGDLYNLDSKPNVQDIHAELEQVNRLNSEVLDLLKNVDRGLTELWQRLE